MTTTPLIAPRSAAARLHMMKLTQPDRDHLDLRQDAVTERAGYAVAKLLRQYDVETLRHDQVAHLVDVLTGRAVQ